ncbi:MAG: hypothetical protein AAGI34_09845 [Pseudomonadota bacterium]
MDAEQEFGLGTIVRHKRTGGLYTVIGHCTIEATWELGVLYTPVGLREPNHFARPIVRPLAEFADGRFERIDVTAERESPSDIGIKVYSMLRTCGLAC